jgi:ABC-type phosphate transport system substrate-binding protein
MVARVVLLLTMLATIAQAQTATPTYRIIVNPGNSASSLDRRFIEDVFLKKIKSWPSGEVARPVDREPNSGVRRRFTEEVLRRPLAAVRAYWQQRIFSGREVPPPEFDRDEEIIQYVMKNPGAIGYVSEGTALIGPRLITIR